MLIKKAEKALNDAFKKIEAVEVINTEKVLEAMQYCKIEPRHFSGTNGYGYDDIGRDTFEQVLAKTFGAEDALVRMQWASGTHVISDMLFGLCKPGDLVISITGTPYDTLKSAIGIDTNKNMGTLTDWGVNFESLDYLPEFKIDYDGLKSMVNKQTPKIVYLQRSRGYEVRPALTIAQTQETVKKIREITPSSYIVMDNCYGEFVETREPCSVGVDVIAGSLIKNPGGGLAPTGGYIAGTKECIDIIQNRMTAPCVGREIGSYQSGYRLLYQGFFMAPHTTAESLKGSLLTSYVLEEMGYDTYPKLSTDRGDIVLSIIFNTEDEIIKFCQAIQSASPIESHVMPMPWAMPGYSDPVIMAAGTFVQGASIELSADAPIRKPYCVYIQGGLTYTHVKIALSRAIKAITNI